jgi:hypothetical protein
LSVDGYHTIDERLETRDWRFLKYCIKFLPILLSA